MLRAVRTTESLHKIMGNAQREAVRLDHRYVEPEHLALGLAIDEDGNAARILRSLGVDLKKLRLAIEETLQPGDALDAPGEELSLRAGRVMKWAEGEASSFDQFGVEGQHLLLAILKENSGAAWQTLTGMDVTYDTVRARVERQMLPRRALRKTSNVVYNVIDYFREPIRLARGRKIPVELSPVFLGIITATILFGVLLYLGVLPIPSLVLFVIGGWVISVCLHEFGHALAAYVGGDFGVYSKGYLSLNPARYAHPVLSVVLPLAFLILGGIPLPGGAVYIDRSAIHDKRMHSFVSAAGPIATFLTALVLLIPFVTGLAYINMEAHYEFWAGLAVLAMLEVASVVLNLLPFPGIDGFGIISPFLPARFVQRVSPLYQFTFIFLFVLFLTPLGGVFWSLVGFLCTQVNLNIDLAFTGFGMFRFWL